MKIAIVAPSPVPFGAGGAEKLWWGLADNINKHTNHQCELIKIPIKENDFWSLIEAYQAFYMLDLAHFDMVISGKYPGWMVQHHNHHIYMLHCLRGFYDCFHFMGLPAQYSTSDDSLNDFLNKVRASSIEPTEVFQFLDSLKKLDSIPSDLFVFPGAFARELIHYFDAWALNNAQRFSAISQTVANRKEYFPANVDIDVIYPPSTLVGLNNKKQEYFFTASRLDDAKRIKIIVEAYLKTTTEIPLKIAGTGPLAEELTRLASSDSRIEFVGYVSDSELVEYYSNAYAIVFIPYDEDYGLITIEAMKSEKPVITFSDAGGVTEFVEHGITGLCSEPSIDLLASNIDKLANDELLCKTLGQAASKRVVDINWSNTIERLLQQTKLSSTNQLDSVKNLTDEKVLRKITVVSTYCFYPPQGGGQNRVFYLYKEIAKHMRVDIICLAHESESYESLEVAPNLFQIKVPKSYEHAMKEWEMQKEAGIPITDIAFIKLYDETQLLKGIFLESQIESDLVVCNQCFTFPFLMKYSTTPIIHDSQNVEYLLKKQMLNDSVFNQNLLLDVWQTEEKACAESVFTTVCAPDDQLTFSEIYQFDEKKSVTVANGVDLQTVHFVADNARSEVKEKLGFAEQKVAIFMGSWHQPNIEAVYEIIKIATKMPNYHFIVMGSVVGYFKNHSLPENIAFTGVVSDDEKQVFLSVADVALNPMLTGSGTNLKMLDYMTSGIPVVTTEVGARGLSIPNELIVVRDVDGFATAISKDIGDLDTKRAYEFAKENYCWKGIASNYYKKLEECFNAGR